MLEKSKRERIIALVNKEVVPAIGCAPIGRQQSRASPKMFAFR